MISSRITNLQKTESKVLTLDVLTHLLNVWRFQSKKIVFTNGCFDILHLGHIDYLSKAADEGDLLVIGLNSDESTKKLKGPHRPINSQDQRAMILASLSFVDAVVIFSEDTPYELIKLIQPSVLIKGADYKPENIVGSDIVMKNGGAVKIIEFLKGYSTSLIEERIKKS